VAIPRLLVAGVVSTSGLGDSLQYSVISLLVSKALSRVRVELAVPGSPCYLMLEVLEKVKIIPGFQESSTMPH